jgi:hypothetical protein
MKERDPDAIILSSPTRILISGYGEGRRSLASTSKGDNSTLSDLHSKIPDVPTSLGIRKGADSSPPTPTCMLR